MSYIEIFVNEWNGYAGYLWKEVTFQNSPWWKNYFLWLVLVSAFFLVLEWIKPWREKQPKFRKDFWIDFFYMFFNFFLFSLVIYNAASAVVVNLFNTGIMKLSGGFDLQANNPINDWPYWTILLFGFVFRDFIQWWIHRLLHNLPWLWQFHKVHHSIEQMGFAGHLRYHFMENIVYRTIEYIPLALLGITLQDFFIIHIFALAIGHHNHSNFHTNHKVRGAVFGFLSGAFIAFVVLGGWASDWRAWAIVAGSTLLWAFVLGRFLKYIFNGPANHIWHHSYELPEDRPYGMNYALSLSCWDYIFGTLYIRYYVIHIRHEFPGIKHFPSYIFAQNALGFFKKHKDNSKEESKSNHKPEV